MVRLLPPLSSTAVWFETVRVPENPALPFAAPIDVFTTDSRLPGGRLNVSVMVIRSPRPFRLEAEMLDRFRKEKPVEIEELAMFGITLLLVTVTPIWPKFVVVMPLTEAPLNVCVLGGEFDS